MRGVGGEFPTLLAQRATLIGNLGRRELSVLGASYLVLSSMKVSALYSIAINLALMAVIQLAKSRLQEGVFRYLWGARKLSWAYKLEEIRG